MHKNQNSFSRERRFVFLFKGSDVPAIGMESAAVRGETHGLLEGLKHSILLPSETVGVAAEKVALTGMAALNVALLGGVFASGLYMILAGKASPYLQKLTGAQS